jgi:hypothetical protein
MEPEERRKEMKKLITAVMLGTSIAPAMAIPPKYQGEWCQVNKPNNLQRELMLCVGRPEDAPYFIKLETDQITINGNLVGKALYDFADYEDGKYETWIMHYDFGARGKHTFKFVRGTNRYGRATLMLQDLNNTRIDKSLREAGARARVYDEPAPHR